MTKSIATIFVLFLLMSNSVLGGNGGIVVSTGDDIPLYSAALNFPTAEGTLQFWVKARPSYVGAVNPRYFGYVNGSDNMELFDLRNPTTDTAPTFYNFSNYSDTTGGLDGTENVYGPATTGDIANWTQVTVTWKQGLDPALYQDVWTYFNGVQVGRNLHHSGHWNPLSSGVFAIGGRAFLPREAPGHVTIDEVRIKNVELTVAEVLADYQRMAIDKLALPVDGNTTFLAHYDGVDMINADFALGEPNAIYGGVSTGVSGEGYPFLLRSGQPGFGKEFVRRHPLSISAWMKEQSPWGFQWSRYYGAGLISPMTVSPDASNGRLWFVEDAALKGIPWLSYLDMNNLTNDPNLGKADFDFITGSGLTGWTEWSIDDEPFSSVHMQSISEIMEYVRLRSPHELTYTNILPDDAGGLFTGSYTYDNYIDDILSVINPDVLMYDKYPFLLDGTTLDTYLRNIMTIRNRALAAGIPYRAYLQAANIDSKRLPSESDYRMGIFSHLTAGYTGFSLTTYDFPDLALLDPNGDPTSLYAPAAAAHAEVKNLGQTLRFLTSTDVRYVASSGNSVAVGMTAWSAGAGGDVNMTDVSVGSGQIGLWKDGIIGFFVDDSNDVYFMLTNLNHAAGTNSVDTSLTLNITFDATIDELLMLNRETGKQEIVTLSNHILSVNLPGGTGNLYKYNTGDFVKGTHDCGQWGLITFFEQGDITGPQGQPDCYVDLSDMTQMAFQWLDCTDPNASSGCL